MVDHSGTVWGLRDSQESWSGAAGNPRGKNVLSLAIGLHGNSQPGRVGTAPLLWSILGSFLKRVPESGHGTGLGGQSG